MSNRNNENDPAGSDRTLDEQQRLSRKRFLQHAGVVGAGAMLGGTLSQNPAFAAPDVDDANADAPRLAQGDVAQGSVAPSNAPASTRGAMVLGETNVRDYGAKGDGKTDDTKAFQTAINEASGRGGGTVFVPQGSYLIASNLSLAPHVTLRGVAQIPDRWDVGWGSVLLAVEGKGNAGGTPFITMQRASVLKGMTILYPEQSQTVPVAYPWTVRGNGDNVSILDCTFQNPYQAVDLGTNPCGRHMIRNLYSQAFYRGVFVDKCYDVGRLENVHFWPFWSDAAKLNEWTRENGIAFQFGRTDWQYLVNCFTIFYKVGFHFANFGNGPGNVLLTNSGADAGGITAQVDSTQSWAGLAFVNANMNGTVQVAKTNEGPIKFSNSSFYGSELSDSNAVIEGNGRVSFDNCHFASWDQNGLGTPSLHVKSGNVGVSNSEFYPGKNHIVLEKEVDTAVIIGNQFRGTRSIVNRSKGDVQLFANTGSKPVSFGVLKRSFYSGFEPGQPQAILNRPDIVAAPGQYSLRVKSGGRSGNALFFSGVAAPDTQGARIAYFRIFDGLKIPITPNTVLRYWLRVEDAAARSTGLDLIFDKATLRETEAKDTQERRMHPADRRGEIGKWVMIESQIGRWAAERTIVAIMAARDGLGYGAFQSVYDDIEIGEPDK